MRRLRLTPSLFGQVKCLKADTAPDNLILWILGVKKVAQTVAMQWGIDHEALAVQTYTEHQHQNGHSGLYVCSTGLYVSTCTSHPFLATSPDGAVYDATVSHPYGFLEIKCPFSQRHLSPVEACGSREIEEEFPKLRRTHPYYSQVQGQMAIGGRMWCDFVIYTENGISIKRISFDQTVRERELFPKLVCFWERCLAPEIVQLCTSPSWFAHS